MCTLCEDSALILKGYHLTRYGNVKPPLPHWMKSEFSFNDPFRAGFDVEQKYLGRLHAAPSR